MGRDSLRASQDATTTLNQIRDLQALGIALQLSSMYRPRPKAWYEKGLVGDLTWPFR